MNVFVVGGTGYVGRQILRDLIHAQHRVVCLVRKGSEKKIPPGIVNQVQIVTGDVEDRDRLRKGITGMEAVIYLPALVREFPSKGLTNQKIVFEGTQRVVDLAIETKVKKILFMSANGVMPNTGIGYQESKFASEEYVKRSGLNWTIFRPSVIFGNEQEGLMNFITVLRGLLNTLPFVVPVIGDGKYELQPISILNVSEGFVKALTRPAASYKSYDLGGPEVFSYNKILDIIAEIQSTRKIKIHQPLFIMKPIISLMERFPFFPVSTAQLSMLLKGNTVPDWKIFFNDFGIRPILFHEGLKQFLSLS